MWNLKKSNKKEKQSKMVVFRGWGWGDKKVMLFKGTNLQQVVNKPQSFFFFINLFILFIYFWLCWVFVAARGAFSSCGERRPLFVAVRGPLTVVASLVAEHRLQARGLQ